jgi:hypothetical protein
MKAKNVILDEKDSILTLIKSNVLVSITIQLAFSCQTILQKSVTVFSVGPCVTMYAFGFSKLCNRLANMRIGHIYSSERLQVLMVVSTKMTPF